MSQKAYITKVSLRYRVIVFSHVNRDPIDVSPYVINVNGLKSVSDSASDSFVFVVKVPDAALTFQVGDWVQIDLETQHQRAEHLFFGQIMAMSGAENLSGSAGGMTEDISVHAVTWGSVLERFVRDLKTYLRMNADTLFPWRQDLEQTADVSGEPKLTNLGEVKYDTPPSLATLAQGKLLAHPWQAVAMVLHYICRYGGTFAQQFWLPRSYTGLKELVPMFEYVARLTHTRLPRGQVLGTSWHGFDDDADNVVKEIEKRDEEDGTFKSNVPEDERVWPYSDWNRVYSDNKAFVPGKGILRDFMTFDLRTTLLDLALDLSDPAFNELYFTLQERCVLGPQRPNQAVDPVTLEKMSFDRSYVMTVAMKPIPHPFWAAKKDTTIVESQLGPLMFSADRSNYERLCPKFVLSIGHNRVATYEQSAQRAYSYWNVVPQDQELKQFEEFDAAAMLRYSSGRVPVIDEELTQTLGHLPMVAQTRYYVGGGSYFVAPTSGPEPFVQVEDTIVLPNPTGPGSVRYRVDPRPEWMVLASKAMALYAWHVRGWELYSGTISMPILEPNVPRPGDVGYLVTHSADGGSRFRHANTKLFHPRLLGPELSSGAISMYVDAVNYALRTSGATSTIQGDITIQYSHGVWCQTPRPNPASLPYQRFVDYAEVGLDPVYYLPAAPGAVRLREELFNEFAQVVTVSAKDLVRESEGEKDETRKKKRRKRARRVRKKKGLRKLGAAKSTNEQVFLDFTLTKLESGEPAEQTKKTKRNPAKKAQYVEVPVYVEYTTKSKGPSLGGDEGVIHHRNRVGTTRRKVAPGVSLEEARKPVVINTDTGKTYGMTTPEGRVE